jgi:hypothetical protein
MATAYLYEFYPIAGDPAVYIAPEGTTRLTGLCDSLEEFLGRIVDESGRRFWRDRT